MSRIGRQPVAIPAGVNISVAKNMITVTGPKGTLSQEFDSKNICVKLKSDEVELTRESETGEVRAKHGLYRALIANMVEGVTKGFSKKLEINGVGYKASVSGNKLTLLIGYSHPIEIIVEDGIKVECPTTNEIVVSGISKEKVGQFASKIRDLRRVEPYHGYGVRYSDEVVVRKVGKTAGKGKK